MEKTPQPDIPTLLMAGIAAANRWHIATPTRIIEIPPERRMWILPLRACDGTPALLQTEEITLEHLKTPTGGIWLGFGPRTNVLLFSREMPLDTDSRMCYNVPNERREQ